MRALAMLAALALVSAPVIVTPSVAYADGIERPRQRPRPRPRPPTPPPPAPVIIQEGPETVTLSDSFFAGGGVGADIGVGAYSSSTVIIRGGSAHASAFAFASARASAGAGGHFGRRGGHGGGHGCGGCR